MINKKCCGDESCVSESCHPYKTCNGSCAQQKIVIEHGAYVLRVPCWVFDNSIDNAKDQGQSVFLDLWNHHNYGNNIKGN